MDRSMHIHQQIPMENLPAPKQLTRRDSLKWLGVLTAGLTLPLISGCESIAISTAKLAGKWPELNLEPITGEGYGTDPNLVSPPDSPWPLTMTPAQRALVGRVADILIPREGSTPSASEVGVPDVLDEWISAPYPSFQADRVELLSGLAWIDQESQRRFGHVFVEIFEQQQLEIIEDIAYEESKSNLRYVYMANVFDGLRALITIAFFSTPEGIRDLGYQGNVPIVGDYPGPTTEAMNHLDGLLQELGLGEHTYS